MKYRKYNTFYRYYSVVYSVNTLNGYNIINNIKSL